MSDASKIDDGGAAFSGMTLRDYFAAAALTGCLAYSHYNDSWGDHHNNGTPSGLATRCFEYADAMIAASKDRRA